jgi:AcrR family transcriptional regulator
MVADASQARTQKRRRYESPRRSQQAAETRHTVLQAAARLFEECGWAATGMRDIAQAADVAVETVYANFGSKVDLLFAALDVAIVGDSEPIALSDRPEFAELRRGRRSDRARAAARLVRAIHERTYGIGKALRAAAAGDPHSAKRLADGEQRRRLDVEEGARIVAQRDLTESERDGLWAVMSMEVYELLVDRAGWSPDQYEKWLAETILRLLPPGKGTR